MISALQGSFAFPRFLCMVYVKYCPSFFHPVLWVINPCTFAFVLNILSFLCSLGLSYLKPVIFIICAYVWFIINLLKKKTVHIKMTCLALMIYKPCRSFKYHIKFLHTFLRTKKIYLRPEYNEISVSWENSMLIVCQ